MKGGKHGRTRRPASGAASRKATKRSSPAKVDSKLRANEPPRKRGKDKPEYGGMRTSGED